LDFFRLHHYLASQSFSSFQTSAVFEDFVLSFFDLLIAVEEKHRIEPGELHHKSSDVRVLVEFVLYVERNQSLIRLSFSLPLSVG